MGACVRPCGVSVWVWVCACVRACMRVIVKIVARTYSAVTAYKCDVIQSYFFLNVTQRNGYRHSSSENYVRYSSHKSFGEGYPFWK